MISFPNIDPVILKIGPLSVRWYGMMYIIGFASSYLLIRYQMKKKGFNSGKAFVDTLYSYIILGLLIGARLGYVIFYNRSYYIRHPFEIFALWYGGMSFHGGLIGSIIAGIIVCRKFKIDFWQIADIVVVTAPIGLGLGRLGNFINGELYGRITNVPWAMVFPTGGPYPRHPSQVYEFLLEGASLFIILLVSQGQEIKTRNSFIPFSHTVWVVQVFCRILQRTRPATWIHPWSFYNGSDTKRSYDYIRCWAPVL